MSSIHSGIKNRSVWSMFMDALSDEFLKQTGNGIYAHITPTDVLHLYNDFQQNQSLVDDLPQNQKPVKEFAERYVRSFTYQ
jgi:hypothetical protein